MGRLRPRRTVLPAWLAILLTALALIAGPSGAALAATPEPSQGPALDAAAWALIDSRDDTVLAAANEDERRSIASTTKMMTAWVALNRLQPTDIARAADYRAEPVESVMGLTPGELISVRDLLYGLFLVSGNDAAVTLARASAGRVPRFVRMMNAEARRLGLDETSYANPVGLDEPGNYSTAGDLARLGSLLLQRPELREIVGAREAVLRSLSPPREIVTRNTLLFKLPWANGIKTGHTMQAGDVLVGSGRRDRVELVAAVLGADSIEARDRETAKLLEYGMSLYQREQVLRKDEVVRRLEIRYSDRRLPLRAERSFAIGRRDDQRLRMRVRAPATVEGPIEAGETIGRAVITLDGERLAVIPLRAGVDVPEAGLLDRLRHWSLRNVAAGLLVLFVILITAALIRRRSQDQPRRGRLG